jgi:hypothetical protein
VPLEVCTNQKFVADFGRSDFEYYFSRKMRILDFVLITDGAQTLRTSLKMVSLEVLSNLVSNVLKFSR